MFWYQCRQFLSDVWGEIVGRPTLKTVIVITGTGSSMGSPGWICCASVGFKLGLFGRAYADMPTLLQFEPQYRARLEKLGLTF